MDIDLPVSLSTRVLNALKANPRTVELRGLAPHYYELAARTLELIDEDEIVDVLLEVRDPAGHTMSNPRWLTLAAVDVQNSGGGNRGPRA